MSGRLILVRHGQSLGNVARRLDTRPPGAELTDVGREQARLFARSRHRAPGLLLHSVARRAEQTATEIGTQWAIPAQDVEGVHEVQAGELEDRDDDDAIAQFNTVYQRWHQGELGVAMPGGETGHDVLGRYLPTLNALRLRFLNDEHWTSDIVVVSHGAAIRLAAATLAGIDGGFVLDHHLANTEAVTLVPVTDNRWSCVRWGSMTPPFYPESDVHPVQDALQADDPMG